MSLVQTCSNHQTCQPCCPRLPKSAAVARWGLASLPKWGGQTCFFWKIGVGDHLSSHIWANSRFSEVHEHGLLHGRTYFFDSWGKKMEKAPVDAPSVRGGWGCGCVLFLMIIWDHLFRWSVRRWLPNPIDDQIWKKWARVQIIGAEKMPTLAIVPQKSEWA